MFTSCYVSGTSCLCVTLTQHTDHGMYLQNTDDLLAQYSRLLLHVIDLLPTSYVTLDNHCLPLCLSNIHKMTRDDSLDFFLALNLEFCMWEIFHTVLLRWDCVFGKKEFIIKYKWWIIFKMLAITKNEGWWQESVKKINFTKHCSLKANNWKVENTHILLGIVKLGL